MQRCVIVGGAPIEAYDRIRSYLQEDDYMIYCDCGLKHEKPLGKAPDLIVGDFDSFPEPETQGEKIVLPREKDDTDTFYAVKTALDRGFSDFLLLGCTGRRLDHTLGNVSILLYLYRRGMTALMADDLSDMQIVGSDSVSIPDSFPYFSLLNITGLVQGITITHAKYPLQNGEIPCEYQYGISNEVLPGKTAQVRVANGELLLIRVLKG